MGMIPDNIYLLVEKRLRERWTAIRKAEKALEKAREKATAISSLQTSSGGSKTRSTASRVERAAILIATAEKALETAKEWDCVFRRLDEVFPPDSSNEGFVASLIYGNGMSQSDVVRFTGSARVTVRRRQDRYVNYAALLAATHGLIKSEEVKNCGDSDQEERGPGQD